ncbi:MAG: HXXEE domain-containing protein [Candidatus Nanopelagicales bacterium]
MRSLRRPLSDPPRHPPTNLHSPSRQYAPVAPWLGFSMIWFELIINNIMHTVLFQGAKPSYNPGLITNSFLLLPYATVTLIVAAGFFTPLDWLPSVTSADVILAFFATKTRGRIDRMKKRELHASVNRHVSLVMHMGERFINRRACRHGGDHRDDPTATRATRWRPPQSRRPRAGGRSRQVPHHPVAAGLRVCGRTGEIGPDEADGRMLAVRLTEAGHDAAGLAEQATCVADRRERWLSPADLQTVDAVFDRFYANGVAHFEG